MIANSNISIVFQGEFPRESSSEYLNCISNILSVRELLPESPILLGTWVGCEVPDNIGIDQIFYVKDPGALPSFKKNKLNIENNINRQILCSRNVLQQVKTKYTLKLRLDCVLSHTGFLSYCAKYGKPSTGNERIIVPCFFTIDPRMYEQMPFHISDWFAFGLTEKIQKWWDAPMMSHNDATYYDTQKFASHSSYFDKLFRTRFAIEQYLAMNYARQLGYKLPDFHNDSSEDILISHDQFVTRELLILDLNQFGVRCKKYEKVAKSSFQKINCLSFLDWCFLNAEQDPFFSMDKNIYPAMLRRAKIKKIFKMLSIVSNPMMPFIKIVPVKFFVSKVLRFVMKLK